jgi:hypothetical protein
MKLKTSGGQLKLSAKAARAQTLALSPAQKQTALWCRCKRSGRRRRRRVRCQKVNPRFCAAAAAARCVCDRFLVNIAHWGQPSKQNNSRHRAISHRFEPYKKAVSCMRNARAVAKRSLQSQTSCLPAGFIAPEILNRDREDARGKFFLLLARRLFVRPAAAHLPRTRDFVCVECFGIVWQWQPQSPALIYARPMQFLQHPVLRYRGDVQVTLAPAIRIQFTKPILLHQIFISVCVENVYCFDSQVILFPKPLELISFQLK